MKRIARLALMALLSLAWGDVLAAQPNRTYAGPQVEPAPQIAVEWNTWGSREFTRWLCLDDDPARLLAVFKILGWW